MADSHQTTPALDSDGRDPNAGPPDVEALRRWNAEGRYEDVLAALTDGDRPAAGVAEGPLAEGRDAAERLGRYRLALDFNEALCGALEARDANRSEQARARLDGIGPLLQLGRRDDAMTALAQSGAVIEAEGSADARAVLAALRGYVARADGDRETALREEEAALRFRYEAEDGAAALHHFNIASLLMETEGDAALALAHRLAAAVLALCTNSPIAVELIAGLVQHRATFVGDAPPLPADFDALSSTLEQACGVSLATLFQTASATGPAGGPSHGDEALRAVLGRDGETVEGGVRAPAIIAQARSALHDVVLNLGRTLAAGVDPAAVAPALEGLRRTMQSVAPELAGETEAWIERLQREPGAVTAELDAAAAGAPEQTG